MNILSEKKDCESGVGISIPVSHALYKQQGKLDLMITLSKELLNR